MNLPARTAAAAIAISTAIASSTTTAARPPSASSGIAALGPRTSLVHCDCASAKIGAVQCLMVSCCTGAELQLRKSGDIVLRELYPMKSDLYERANELKTEYGTQSA